MPEDDKSQQGPKRRKTISVISNQTTRVIKKLMHSSKPGVESSKPASHQHHSKRNEAAFTESVKRLFKPVMKTPHPVNWIRSVLTWENLQGPISAVVAVTLGGLAAVLTQTTSLPLSPSTVMSITTIVMEMGSTERVFIRSGLRIVGSVAGALAGVGMAAVANAISNSNTHNYTATQSFQLVTVAIVAVFTFFGMKVFEETAYAFMMFAVTYFSILYTVGWVPMYLALLSSLTGIGCSLLTILMFQYPRAQNMLAETHKKAVENLFTLIRFSISLDPRAVDDFQDCTNAVRKALSATAASFEVYSQWRRWTKRKVEYNYDGLTQTTRPLFYVSYSLYWSLVMAPSGNALGGTILFCDNLTVYDVYFRQPRMMFEGAIMSIQESLCRILVRDPKDACHPHHHIEMIVTRHMWFGCMRNLHILKELYMEHKDECFSTTGQHWSIIEYLHQAIGLTMALCGYLHVIAEIFLPEIAQHVYPILEDICENLSNIRNEGILRCAVFSSGSNQDSRTTTGGDNSKDEYGRSYRKSSSASEDAANIPHYQPNYPQTFSTIPRNFGRFEESFSEGEEPITPNLNEQHYPGTINRYTLARFQKDVKSADSSIGEGSQRAIERRASQSLQHVSFTPPEEKKKDPGDQV